MFQETTVAKAGAAVKACKLVRISDFTTALHTFDGTIDELEHRVLSLD